MEELDAGGHKVWENYLADRNKERLECSIPYVGIALLSVLFNISEKNDTGWQYCTTGDCKKQFLMTTVWFVGAMT